MSGGGGNIFRMGLTWTVMLSNLLIAVAQPAIHEPLPSPPSLEDILDMVGEFPLDTVADLDAYTKTLLDLARLQITKSFSVESRRYRRALDIKSVNVTGTQAFKFDFKAGGLSGLFLLVKDGHYYFILGCPRSEYQYVLVMSAPDYVLQVVARFKISSVSIDRVDKMAVHIYQGFLWLAFGSSSSRLVTIVCIHLASSQVRFPQNLPTRGVVGGLHFFEIQGVLYLVVSQHYYTSPDDTAVESAVYMLMERYFDRRDSFKLKTVGVRAVTGFTDAGNYYLVFGMNSDGGSQVYWLNPISDTLTLIQELPDTNVVKVIHYQDRHDDRHFIITLNLGGSPKIYWWDNRQLVEWQVLQSEPLATDSSVGVLTLDNLENIIVISSGGILTFYTDDLTAHYFPSLTVTTSCTTIQDIFGIKVRDIYILYYVCTGPLNQLEARAIQFENVLLAESETKADPLLECLEDLDSLLDERKDDITYLENFISSGTLSTDHSQIWKGPVTFTELNVTGATFFSGTLQIIPPDGRIQTSESFGAFSASLHQLENEVNVLQRSMSNVLYYTGDQELSGPLNITTLDAESVDIDFLTINKINGIPLEDLARTFLLDGVDQRLTSGLSVQHLYVDRFTTSGDQPGTINGILTNDFMRLSVGDQVVTGNHIYGTLSANNIFNTLCNGISLDINGIDTNTIVTKGADVTFHDKKTFVNVDILGNLQAQIINGVSIDNLFAQVVYVDESFPQTLVGTYTLGNVVIRGNADVGSINGVDLRNLDSRVVKTTGNYRLEGNLVYKNEVTVTNSLTVESINGIQLEDLVDMDSSGKVIGDFFFTNVHITGDLSTNNLNGLDISQDVVLTDTVQTINGRITFLNSVPVQGIDGVVMETGGTVNGIDPSELGNMMSGNGVLVITEPVTFTGPLIVGGDLTVETVNGLSISSLLTDFWRFSIEQDIFVNVHIRNVVFRQSVIADTLNGRPLSDYLHIDGDEVITGTYIFQGKVTVDGMLMLEDGNTVNGVDLSELVKKVMTLEGQQNINERTTFTGKVTILGDLELSGRLNGIDVRNDLMRLDLNLPHIGNLRFASKTVTRVLELPASDLTVETLNGLDVAFAARDVVLRNEDASIIGGAGLRFTGELYVRNLFVSGTVDGVNFDGLATRALLKRSDVEQQIFSRIVVENDVHFGGQLTLNQVNRKDWTTYLNNVVQLGYSGLIQGRKIFTQSMEIRNNFNPTSINGIDVSALASRILTRSTDQTILRVYTFSNSISATDLNAEIIDGLRVDSIMLIDGSTLGGTLADFVRVGGTVIFNQHFELLNGLSAEHSVLDGCDIQQLQGTVIWSDMSVVKISSNVVIDNLSVIGNVTCDGRVLGVSPGKVIDIKHFLNTLVLRSTDQVITEPVQFINNVSIGQLIASTIDNIRIDEFFQQAVLKNESSVINCDISFTKELTVGSLTVTNSVSGLEGGVLLNNVDLSDIHSRAVLLNGGTALISGQKTFTSAFSVENLVVNDKIGDVLVTDLVLLTNTNAIVENLTFTAPIRVLGNLLVTGLVDGVDLAEFFRNRVTLAGDQTIITAITFDNVRVNGDLEVDQINDVKLSDLVLRLSGGDQEITGVKILSGGLHVIGSIELTVINNIDIVRLFRTIVRVNVDTTFLYHVIFESSVISMVEVIVNGTVDNYDLSLLGNITHLREQLEQQYLRIDILRSQFGSIIEENFIRARGMFAEVAYLERIRLPQDVQVYGELWYGRASIFGYDFVLKIVQCLNPPCGCDITCHYYLVDGTGKLTLAESFDFRFDLFSHELASGFSIAILTGCSEGAVRTNILAYDEETGSSINVPVNLGLVSDSTLFVVDGVPYLVVAGKFINHLDPSERTAITVITPSFSRHEVEVVWRIESTRSASSVDVVIINGVWYLLVANHYDGTDFVDPYTVKSQVFVWDNFEKQFILKAEYVADHVSSGRFVSVVQPFGLFFFSLAQLKAADCPIYEDNLKYTTEVLIFKYNQINGNFEAFQSLAAYGIVDQVSLLVDDTVYLLMVSTWYNCLYVYKYYHPEGFVLYQKITVTSPYSIVVLEVGGRKIVAVSTPNGIIRFRLRIKGLDPSNLLQ